jgi:hypothetical protein
VENGTLEAQRVTESTLAGIASLPKSSPSLVVVGEVVGLREAIGWFEGAEPEPETVSPARLAKEPFPR